MINPSSNARVVRLNHRQPNQSRWYAQSLFIVTIPAPIANPILEIINVILVANIVVRLTVSPFPPLLPKSV
jgi:hypothetical protein